MVRAVSLGYSPRRDFFRLFVGGLSGRLRDGETDPWIHAVGQGAGATGHGNAVKRRQKPLDFCAVHDYLLKKALKAPKNFQKAYEFRVTFRARRTDRGVLIEGLKIERDV